MLDVAVVGAGPAGLATAIEAAQLGLRVEVFDRQKPPIDKACGEGLMPDGVARLGEMGVRLEEQIQRIDGIRYLDQNLIVDGAFPEGYLAVGIRRTRLHAALIRRATDLGIPIHWQRRIQRLAERGIETERGRVESRFIVGADGLRSKIRQWAGLQTIAKSKQRFGIRRHYRFRPWTRRVEVYWAAGCEAYITPVAEDEVGVAILRGPKKEDFDTLLQKFPGLWRRFQGAEIISRDRGNGPFHQRCKRVVTDRIALVGDAAGYLDAITGEGLSIAFHQAHALASALRANDLPQYAAQHRSIDRVPKALTRTMLWLQRHARLRQHVFRVLAAEPKIFERFLAVHCREVAPASIAGVLPRFLWRSSRVELNRLFS